MPRRLIRTIPHPHQPHRKPRRTLHLRRHPKLHPTNTHITHTHNILRERAGRRAAVAELGVEGGRGLDDGVGFGGGGVEGAAFAGVGAVGLAGGGGGGVEVEVAGAGVEDDYLLLGGGAYGDCTYTYQFLEGCVRGRYTYYSHNTPHPYYT